MKVPRCSVTVLAVVGGILSAAVMWFWLASSLGRAYLTLAVLWCCGSDANEVSIILNHDPSLVGAVTSGITIACIIAALGLIFRPGEKNANHIKYDILRTDR